MTITRSVAAAGCVLGLLAGIVFADAKSDYEILFGDEAKKVLATKSTADDAVFAKRLLDAAKAITAAPKTQVFIYEKVVQFGGKDVTGTPHALEAIGLLIKAQPGQKAKWQEAKLNVTEKQYQMARGLTRREAAKAYLDVLIEIAEAKTAAGKPMEAMKLYRKGVPVAAYAQHKLSEIRDRLRKLEAQAECEELIKKVADDPKDTKAREKLILIYVLERDDPAKAASFLATGVDQNLRECIPLAAKRPVDLTETACTKLGDWYKQLAAKASVKGKPTALARAKIYYERYLSLHTKRDMGRYKASAALRDIEDAIAAAIQSPKQVKPTIQPKITTIGVSVKEPWPVALKVQKGQVLYIEAKGKWYKSRKGKPLGPGDLQGRLGDGEPFRIGERFTLVIKKDGILHLGMRGAGMGGKVAYSDNRGNITVTVRVDKEQPTRTIGISFDSPRVAAQSLQRFYTQAPSKWQVAKGKIVGHGPEAMLTYKTWFQEITRVTIKGGIVLPSTTNFRVAVGPINLIFNWEGGKENCYGLAEAKRLTRHKGHALIPGKLHTIVVEQTGEKVIVSVDDKTVYTTKAVLHGTVTVYPYKTNTIGIVEIEIVGKADRNREVQGPSHRVR